MKTPLLICTLLVLVSTQAGVLSKSNRHLFVEPNEHLPGGTTTHFKPRNRDGFLHASPTLTLEEKLDFKVGQAIFEKIWVFAPSSTTASDGLGPLYNARSCHQCHIRNGRGQAPVIDDKGKMENTQAKTPVSLFLRLSIAPETQAQKDLLSSGKVGFIPEPNYGKQLQTFAYPGGQAEGRLSVVYETIEVELNGETLELSRPTYQIDNLGYGPLHASTMISPRIASPMIGLGLLEAISAEDLIANADPEDDNQDGISGKANLVWDEAEQELKLGRFGWKAGNPTLDQQNKAALNGDIGIGSNLFPSSEGDCTVRQTACLAQPNGNTHQQDNLEASNKMTKALLHFTRYIAPPARNNYKDERVLAGKQVFYDAGCHHCHTPKFITRADAPSGLNGQIIWPYSDLLLHDMGEELADHRPEFDANGREWRTPPLWGIGLTKQVGGKQFFLHDGRARTLLEAILWHGGEAEASRQSVIRMEKMKRDNLIRFLESL